MRKSSKNQVPEPVEGPTVLMSALRQAQGPQF